MYYHQNHVQEYGDKTRTLFTHSVLKRLQDDCSSLIVASHASSIDIINDISSRKCMKVVVRETLEHLLLCFKPISC